MRIAKAQADAAGLSSGPATRYGSREIAAKLFLYASLVEGEMYKRKAVEEVTGYPLTWLALEAERDEAQAMANYLHELKEPI